MLKPDYTNLFKKELDLMFRRGKDKRKVAAVISKLVNQEPLEPKHRDHALKGGYKGRRDCHIEPDWVLIYKIEGDAITFERTGTHSDLFR
jgi:mRNA interferase YafQ